MNATESMAKVDQVPRDFSRNPLLVYWEVTHACGLACKSRRGYAEPNSLELTPTFQVGVPVVVRIYASVAGQGVRTTITVTP